MSGKAANLAVAVASVCLTLALFETAVRLLVVTTDVPLHRADRVVGYGLQPNQEGRWISTASEGSFRINGAGFNNENDYVERRTPGRRRIAILGDSFVESFQVHRGERFFDLLQERLKSAGLDTEIYTFGVSGYGTGQEMLLLESEVLRYQPDLVLVVFVENDLRDTACVLPQSGDEPCFRLDDSGTLSVDPVPPHKPNLLGRATLHSAALRYLLVQRRLVERLRSFRGDAARQSIDAIYLEDPPAPWREAWRVVGACLARMEERCRRSGIRFLVTNHVLMDPPFAPPEGGTGADRDRPARVLEEITREHRIEFIDLTPAFRLAASRDPEPLTIPADGHWSVRGHRLVAETLFAPIRDALREPAGLRPTRVGPASPAADGDRKSPL